MTDILKKELDGKGGTGELEEREKGKTWGVEDEQWWRLSKVPEWLYGLRERDTTLRYKKHTQQKQQQISPLKTIKEFFYGDSFTERHVGVVFSTKNGGLLKKQE